MPSADPRENVRLALALTLGVVGTASAMVAGDRSGPLRLGMAAWAGSLVVYGWPVIRRRWPSLRGRLLVPPAPSAAVFAVAVALTAAAAHAWVLVPLALAAWTAVAVVVQAGWTSFLACAAAVLVAAAALLSLGVEPASEALAALAYGLAWLGCSTAAARRLGIVTRRIRSP